MSTNLRVLTKETQPQYAPQCPVLLEACALYGDSASGRCVAQLKWRALVPGIRALSVTVHTYDAFGEPVESAEHQYAEISAASGECFGSREAVRLRSSKGRRMRVCVSAASLQDGTVWTNDEQIACEPLPANMPLPFAQDARLTAQYRRDLASSSISQDAATVRVQSFEDLWQCGCGTWQKKMQRVCLHCGAMRRSLMAAANEELLRMHLDAYEQEMEALRVEREREAEERRIAWEKQEAERRAKEAREERERKRIAAAQERQRQARRKRNRAIFIVLLLLAALGFAGFYTVKHIILPAGEYAAAQKLAKDGRYDDASAAFAQMGNYRDAQDMVTGVYYLQGKQLMDGGDYAAAADAFARAGSYKDAAACIPAAHYAGAKHLLASGQEEAAHEAFIALGDYSDAKAQAHAIRMAQAERMAQQGDLSGAAKMYLNIGETQKYNETMYAYAESQLAAGESVGAARVFHAIGSYEDAQQRRYDIGISLNAKGSPADAITVLALDLDYKQARDTVYNLARTASGKGEYAVSVAGYKALGAYKDSAMNLTMDTYAYGEQLHAQGRYDEAAAVFQEMNGFSDTAERARQSRYAAAAAALERGEYDDAIDRFKALDNYSDSKKMVQESLYRKAGHCHAQGDYKQAAELYKNLSDYRDSAEKALESLYAEAGQMRAQGKFMASAAAFDALADYEDAPVQATNARYDAYAQMLEDRDYDDAITGFESLGDHKDSPAKAAAAHYGRAQQLEEIGAGAQAIYSHYALAGEHEDARTRAAKTAYGIASDIQNRSEYDQAALWYERAGDYADSREQLYKIGEFYFATQDYKNAMSALRTLSDYESGSDYLYRIGEYFSMAPDALSAAKAYHYAGDYKDSRQKRDKFTGELRREAQTATSNGSYARALELYRHLLEIGQDVKADALIAEFFAFLTAPGRTFTFGTYPQKDANVKEPILWRYLGTPTSDKSLFLSVKAIDYAPHDTYYKNHVDNWLKNAKDALFSAQEIRHVRNVQIPSANWIKTYLPTDADRICEVTAYAKRSTRSSTYRAEGVWTSTKGESSMDNYIAYDEKTGKLDTWGSLDFHDNYIRPVFQFAHQDAALCDLLLSGGYSFYDADGKPVEFVSEFADKPTQAAARSLLPAQTKASAQPAAPAASIVLAGNEYITTSIGFVSDVYVHVSFDENGAISAIEIDASGETPGIGQLASGETYTSKFIGKTLPLTIGENIDMLSGATYTSNAVITALNSLLD